MLYNETNPLDDDIGALQASDVSHRPDLLLIMGTSLKVHGVRRLVREFAKAVHAGASGGKSSLYTHKVVFVNKTPPGSEWTGVIDYHVGGETDVWAGRVLDDWQRARPTDWEVRQIPEPDGEGISSQEGEGTVGGTPSRQQELEPLRVEIMRGAMDAFGQGSQNMLLAKTDSKVRAELEDERSAPAGRGRPMSKGDTGRGVKRTASSADTPRCVKMAAPANKRKVELSFRARKLFDTSEIGAWISQRTRPQNVDDVEVDIVS